MMHGKLVALAVFGLAAWLSVKHKAKLVCKPGYHFVPADETSDSYVNGSAAFRAGIKKYGGYCSAPGNVTFDNGSLDAPDVEAAVDIEDTDGGLITRPSQLP